MRSVHYKYENIYGSDWQSKTIIGLPKVPVLNNGTQFIPGIQKDIVLNTF